MKVDYVPIYPEGETSLSPNGGSAEEAILDAEDSNIDYYAHAEGSKRRIEISKEEGNLSLTTACSCDISRLIILCVFAAVSKKIKSDGARKEEKGEIPYETPVRCAMCFICRPKAKEGTLLIDKCVEKGVPAGPLLGRLKAGHDVTLPNGTVVLAKDVRSPDCVGPVFIG